MKNIVWGAGFFLYLYAVFYLVPPAEGLGELVRIAFFHIPVAWISVLAFLLSACWGAKYLQKRDLAYDRKSAVAAGLGLFFCILATFSGAVFAKLTWGAYWNWDPRQTTIFVLLLIYGAYISLRQAVEDEEQRAKVSAIYGLLSFLTVPFLVFIIPRFYFSLHPSPLINGSGTFQMDAVMVSVLLYSLLFSTAVFGKILCFFVQKKEAKSLYQSQEEGNS